MYKLGSAKGLSDGELRSQAAKAKYEEISAMDNMRLAFIKRNNIVIIYKNDMVEGGVI